MNDKQNKQKRSGEIVLRGHDADGTAPATLARAAANGLRLDHVGRARCQIRQHNAARPLKGAGQNPRLAVVHAELDLIRLGIVHPREAEYQGIGRFLLRIGRFTKAFWG